MRIPKPTAEIVREYLARWQGLQNYVLQESSLQKLFTRTYRSNNCLDDVLIKVCSLNDFYSTNIFSPFDVARHIVRLQIDDGLRANDLDLVNRIASVRMRRGRIINFYSFATKYCSHHRPDVYPIYDSYVEKMLMHFRRADGFLRFRRDALKEYPEFVRVLTEFQRHYGLREFGLKQIDRYLWQAGKKYFPKKFR